MKKIFKGILFSIITLAVGYGAMALPFHLFSELTRGEMRILFAAEIIVYFAIVSAVMLARESKQQKRALRRSAHQPRKQNFLDMQSQICTAYDFEIEANSFPQAA